MKKRRTYKNKAEEEFCEYIEKQGLKPIKRGWPDFFCYDKRFKRLVCVEVKPTRKHPLKKEQLLVCKYLASYGIPVFRWDLEDKMLERINWKTSRKKKVTNGHVSPPGNGQAFKTV